MYLLERAREKGVRLIEGRVERIDTAGGRVRAVSVGVHGGEEVIWTKRFVNAAGPFLKPVGRLLGVDLPVYCERHAKLAFKMFGAVPRHAPMLI
jgi:glycine/D-amino acid oxidase-like deaminating enzyme